MTNLVYSITEKAFFVEGMIFASGCWAGRGIHKNKPESCNVKSEGPLPIGKYAICKAVRHPRLGAMSIQLIPYSDNVMHGRSDFWIHGAAMNPTRFGQESMGCIICPRVVRHKIDNQDWDYLEVVA